MIPRTAALVSGGLDSAVLVAELTRAGHTVTPIYIRQGLRWEAVEQLWLWRWLRVVGRGRVAPLVTLALPVGDLYDTHWSVTGRRVPRAADPDEAVELPGRNLLLVAKAAVYCGQHRIPRIALGSLKGNPFGDATPAFRRALSRAVTLALGRPLTIVAPLASSSKTEVIRRGRALPLGWTFSCLRPVAAANGRGGTTARGPSVARHCGRCQKCGERRQGFAAAGVPDPTRYADRPSTILS